MLSKVIYTFLIMLSLITQVKAKAPDEWIAQQELKGNVKYSKVDGTSYIKVTELYNGLGTDMKQENIYEVLPSGEKKIAARKVIVINPYELRELEVGDKYWTKNDPNTSSLQNTYSILLKKIDDNLLESPSAQNQLQEKACPNICEEVTEKYVICNGNKYILDMKNDDKLKRDLKRIEKIIDPNYFNMDSKAVPK